MLRFLAGGVAALLLAAGGVLFWTTRAEQEQPVPEAPAQAAAAESEAELPDPPAASAKTREERRFGRYDKDKDGIITRAEMLETRRKPFQKLDKNGDGKLSFEEWSVATAERFGGADKDRSGTLTAAEFATTRRAQPAASPRCRC
jgi:hypothetical protein